MSEISSNKQNANNKRKLQKKVNSMTNKKKKEIQDMKIIFQTNLIILKKFLTWNTLISNPLNLNYIKLWINYAIF